MDSDEERFKFLDRAHELGERFWDTSDFYGDNEDLIGKWFKKTGKRKDIFLATKFGGTVYQFLLLCFCAKGFADAGGGVKLNTGGGSEGARYGVRGDKEYVHEAYQKSSTRLGVDYIDLYYIHRYGSLTMLA